MSSRLNQLCQIAVVPLFLLTATRAHAQSYQVQKAKLTITAVSETEKNGAPVIEKIKVTSAMIIRSALGLSDGTPLSTNQVLALVSVCEESPVALIVWDKALQSNLVTVARTMAGAGVRSSATAGQGVLQMDFAYTGSADIGITEGFLALRGSYTEQANGCLKTLLSTNLLGYAEVRFVDNNIPKSSDVLFTGGKLRVGSAVLGQLTEAP